MASVNLAIASCHCSDCIALQIRCASVLTKLQPAKHVASWLTADCSLKGLVTVIEAGEASCAGVDGVGILGPRQQKTPKYAVANGLFSPLRHSQTCPALQHQWGAWQTQLLCQAFR